MGTTAIRTLRHFVSIPSLKTPFHPIPSIFFSSPDILIMPLLLIIFNIVLDSLDVLFYILFFPSVFNFGCCYWPILKLTIFFSLFTSGLLMNLPKIFFIFVFYLPPSLQILPCCFNSMLTLPICFSCSLFFFSLRNCVGIPNTTLDLIIH